SPLICGSGCGGIRRSCARPSDPPDPILRGSSTLLPFLPTGSTARTIVEVWAQMKPPRFLRRGDLRRGDLRAASPASGSFFCCLSPDSLWLSYCIWLNGSPRGSPRHWPAAEESPPPVPT